MAGALMTGLVKPRSLTVKLEPAPNSVCLILLATLEALLAALPGFSLHHSAVKLERTAKWQRQIK